MLCLHCAVQFRAGEGNRITYINFLLFRENAKKYRVTFLSIYFRIFPKVDRSLQ